MGKLLFLGTGASMGIPVIGCHCPVCLSPSAFNKRLRPSVLIKIDKKQFLVDVGPDFRFQALFHQLTYLDGVLLTHSHQDHVAGIDDLRPIFYKRETPLPVLLSKETADDLVMRYHYIFHSKSHPAFVSRLNLCLLPSHQEGNVIFEGISIGYVTYEQAKMSVNGYRFGDLAYLSDMRHFSDTIFHSLAGIKTLVIGALKHTSSALHFSIDEAIDFAKQAKAETVWLTHLSHEVDHELAHAELPSYVKLAYDGLEIDFNE